MGGVDMLGAKLVLAAVMIAAGGVIVWTARAGASGRLKRNYWAGIRTRTTLASDDAWFAAHRAARPPVEAGGWAAAAAGVVVLFLPADPEALIPLTVIAGAVVMLALIMVGAWRGVRAAKAALNH